MQEFPFHTLKNKNDPQQMGKLQSWHYAKDI